mgnify:CR=1 FL=1
MTTPVVEARAVGRVLGEEVKQEVLKDVDLSVAPGEFVALTGHSGSGKSTLLYLLGILDRPTKGSVWVDGVDAGPLDDDERAALRNNKLGFVFQFHFLLGEFSAEENVMIPMLRRGVPRDEASGRAKKTLERLGIPELAGRRPGQMSGGQQQRVSIARAIANEPKLLLADEPTGNLDSVNAAVVMELFEKMSEDLGMAMVMVTHDNAFAARAARRLVMRDGRIVEEHARGT